MSNIINLILLAFFILLIVLGGWLSYENKASASLTPFCAAFLCLIFLCPDTVKSFKGLGLEVELQEKIHRADELLKYLHDLAVPVTEMNISTMMRMGRWDSSMPKEEAARYYEKIITISKRLNFSNAEITSISRDYHFYNIFDLKNKLYGSMAQFFDPIEKDLNLENNNFKVVNDKNREAYDLYIKRHRNYYSQKNKFEGWLQNRKLTNNADEFINLVNNFDEFNSETKTKILAVVNEDIQNLRFYEENSRFRDFKVNK